MMTPRRSLRTLDIVSVMLLTVAAVVFWLPVGLTIPSGVSAAADRGIDTAQIARPDDNDADRVVAANLFSSSRRAPMQRYTSPELTPAADYRVPQEFSPGFDVDSTLPGVPEADAVPGLYGIVNSDGRWRALLRLTETDVNPVLLAEGDKRGPYRIVSIRPNAVVVAGPSGQRTLRLARSSRGDSTEKQL